MGGRDSEMTFGIGEVKYQEMYIHGDDDEITGSLTLDDDETGLHGDADRSDSGTGWF